jgi:hypothetical protein
MVPIEKAASPPLNRGLSLAEFAVGVVLVIGHNVFRVIPNEVPILFVLGLVSVRLREGGWAALGLQRPSSWTITVLFAVAATIIKIVLELFVINPATARFWPAEIAPAGADRVVHNLSAALIALLISWTFAAFGEEIGYRGYLTKRAADLGRGSLPAWWAATVAVSVLFGFGHYYKGPAGILDSAVSGLVLGSVYLLSRRNLWTAILAHGFLDTVAVVYTYLGLNS